MPKGDNLKFKADPEDGTTPIANLLLEAVAVAKLSGKEKGAILYLWRRTYGWKDKLNGKRIKERIIPLSEWQKALVTNDTNASVIISGLVKKNIFKREFLGPGKGYIYKMNTEIQSWNSNTINMEDLQSLITLVETHKSFKNREPSLIKNDNPPLSNSITPLASNLASLKKDIKKDIKKKSSQVEKPDPLNELRARVFELLKEKRGYNSPKPGAEAKAITLMLKQGYSIEDIMNAYTVMSKKPFWKDKELFMASVQGQIGKIKKGYTGGGLPTTEALKKSWG